jgi:hypothetical protein
MATAPSDQATGCARRADFSRASAYALNRRCAQTCVERFTKNGNARQMLCVGPGRPLSLENVRGCRPAVEGPEAARCRAVDRWRRSANGRSNVRAAPLLLVHVQLRPDVHLNAELSARSA